MEITGKPDFSQGMDLPNFVDLKGDMVSLLTQMKNVKTLIKSAKRNTSALTAYDNRKDAQVELFQNKSTEITDSKNDYVDPKLDLLIVKKYDFKQFNSNLNSELEKIQSTFTYLNNKGLLKQTDINEYSVYNNLLMGIIQYIGSNKELSLEGLLMEHERFEAQYSELTSHLSDLRNTLGSKIDQLRAHKDARINYDYEWVKYVASNRDFQNYEDLHGHLSNNILPSLSDPAEIQQVNEYISHFYDLREAASNFPSAYAEQQAYVEWSQWEETKLRNELTIIGNGIQDIKSSYDSDLDNYVDDVLNQYIDLRLAAPQGGGDSNFLTEVMYDVEYSRIKLRELHEMMSFDNNPYSYYHISLAQNKVHGDITDLVRYQLENLLNFKRDIITEKTSLTYFVQSKTQIRDTNSQLAQDKFVEVFALNPITTTDYLSTVQSLLDEANQFTYDLVMANYDIGVNSFLMDKLDNKLTNVSSAISYLTDLQVNFFSKMTDLEMDLVDKQTSSYNKIQLDEANVEDKMRDSLLGISYGDNYTSGYNIKSRMMQLYYDIKAYEDEFWSYYN